MQIFFNHNTKFLANPSEKKCTVAGFGDQTMQYFTYIKSTLGCLLHLLKLITEFELTLSFIVH